MQPCFSQNSEIDGKIDFLIGCKENFEANMQTKTLEPFSEEILFFLNKVSKILLGDKETKAYPDIVTYAFWIRNASTSQLKERFHVKDRNCIRLGRGNVFHIAPSNVPVNYAYSLTAGILTGNKNIVRVSSKSFPQVNIINRAYRKALSEHPWMEPYVTIVRYDRSQEVNDYFSKYADVRVVWGGDQTIGELRKSPLPVRSREITFADRYSLAVIDSEYYMEKCDAAKVAIDFYNDTYLTDQNACTSPKIIFWTGSKITQAKEKFWQILQEYVEKKYELQPVQAVEKLTNMYLAAADIPCYWQKMKDNLIVRVQLQQIDDRVLKLLGNSGYFYEYDCTDLCEIQPVISDKCQTIGYIGDKNMFGQLLDLGVDGIDRIVPLGKTMDFDLIWDGYNLVTEMTREIYVG